MSVSVFPLALAILVVAAMLGVVIAAIRHKRWGIVLAIPMLVLGVAVLLPVLSMQRPPDFANVAPAMPRAPTPPMPEVATDAELEAVAAAAPKIQLEDSDASEDDIRSATAAAIEAAQANQGVENADGPEAIDIAKLSKSLPAWVTAEHDANQKVFTSGPFTSFESCREDAQHQLAAWVEEKTLELGWGPEGARAVRKAIDAAGPDAYLELVKKTNLSEVSTSVGVVYLQHILAAFSDDDVDRINTTAQAALGEHRRRTGVRAVTFGGAGALGLLTLAHVVLRAGGRSKPTD